MCPRFYPEPQRPADWLPVVPPPPPTVNVRQLLESQTPSPATASTLLQLWRTEGRALLPQRLAARLQRHRN
jgi:hypothetical protein